MHIINILEDAIVNNNSPFVQILRLVDEVYEAEGPKPMGRGRPRSYKDLVILKVFIVMVIKRIKTFKGYNIGVNYPGAPNGRMDLDDWFIDSLNSAVDWIYDKFLNTWPVYIYYYYLYE